MLPLPLSIPEEHHGHVDAHALIATETGKEVCTGPVEATAIGNLLAQMLKDEVFMDLDEAREMVAKSFDVKRVEETLRF